MNNQLPNLNNQINSNIQIPITKRNMFGILVIGHWLLFGYWCLVIGVSSLYAQDSEKVVVLSKQIVEAKTTDTLYAPFEELYNLYFSRLAIKSEGGIPSDAGKENKYSEFADFLKSLDQKNKLTEPFINYYMALTRYNQLKYLEEKQMWDEYFAQGNSYREGITNNVKSVLDKTSSADALNIYSRLLIWRFHKDQQDAFVDESLSDLMNAVGEYSKSSKDAKPIRDAADILSVYGEKGKSKELYRFYAERFSSSDVKDDVLLNNASNFYKEGNLELSETFYDAYMGRIPKSLTKEKSVLVLIDVAKLFAHRDKGLNGPLYAEKVFKKIEELGGKEAFDQELIYLRAFNLEKSKEYRSAKDIYADLIKRFPESLHNKEAIFKMGIISAYISSDIKSARSYFEKLANGEKDLSTHSISSLYQLGLLSQWEGDSIKAKEYYDKIMNIPSLDSWDTQGLVRERLKEIEEGKPIDYNLKTFLDLSLKGDSLYDMTKSDLKASVYRLKKSQEDNIVSSVTLPQSGCMQVELQYLWSGHTGSAKPSFGDSSFKTSYSSAGTKEINLVVVSPTGIVDRNIDLLDVD